MQSNKKWNSEGREYGYKRRKKMALSLFESKGKPDPIKFYFFAIFFLLLGVLGALLNQHQIEERRFKNPTTINVEFVKAKCERGFRSGRPTRYFHMLKIYEYSPKKSGGLSQTYEIHDSISFTSKSACEADLQNANTISPLTEVWYDQAAPWNARKSLDEPSPVRVFWYFSAPAGLFFLFGLFEHRKMKQHRKHTIRNG